MVHIGERHRGALSRNFCNFNHSHRDGTVMKRIVFTNVTLKERDYVVYLDAEYVSDAIAMYSFFYGEHLFSYRIDDFYLGDRIEEDYHAKPL